MFGDKYKEVVDVVTNVSKRIWTPSYKNLKRFVRAFDGWDKIGLEEFKCLFKGKVEFVERIFGVKAQVE